VADPRQGPVLVTDFDGTLYRGDAPIRFYARHAAADLSAAGRTALLDAVERYLSHGVAAADGAAHPDEAEALRRAQDGWEAVAKVAIRRHAVTRQVLDRAFLATRSFMTTPGCALEVPAAYRDLLSELRAGGVRVVLATNSPPGGLDELLDRLGVRPLLDAVVSSTAKPAGLTRLLRAELGGAVGPDGPGDPAAQIPAEVAARAFAIGDHWVNDVEPALRLCVPGGYIDRYGRCDGPATAAAPDVEGLLPALRSWADDPAPAGHPAVPDGPPA
jgi:FMN phosphatase YigB (HAD superfamily)